MAKRRRWLFEWVLLLSSASTRAKRDGPGTQFIFAIQAARKETLAGSGLPASN